MMAFPTTNLEQWGETLKRSNIKAQYLSDMVIPDCQEVVSALRFASADGKHWVQLAFTPDGDLCAIKVLKCDD